MGWRGCGPTPKTFFPRFSFISQTVTEVFLVYKWERRLLVSESKLLIHSQITHQLTRETATKTLTMRRQKNPSKSLKNLLLRNKLCSSVAWLVRIQLFHLSFRFRLPLALFPRSFSPSPSPLGVNFLLLSKGMGTGRGSDALRRDQPAPDGVKHSRGRPGKLLSSVVQASAGIPGLGRILMIFNRSER